MKTLGLISLTFLISINLFAQKIDEDKEKVWYGVDFSNTYLIGEQGFRNPEILNQEFKKLNFKIVNEVGKYNLGRTFNQKVLLFDFTPIFNNMNKIDFAKNIKAKNTDSKITFDDLQKIINGYSYPDKNKIGIIYIVEELNKFTETATVIVVAFDTDTKKITSAKRYRGLASGIGIASHWANAIARINQKIRFNNNIVKNSTPKIKTINL